MPDDEDGPRDAAGAPDATWADVRAPDDLSALAADVEAYRREQRATARRMRRRRVMRRPGVLPLMLAAGAMILAGVVATLLTVLAPRIDDSSPRPAALSTTTLAVGTVGGLIPAVALRDDNGQTVASRDLRPAVLALVPAGCASCGRLLDSLAGQAFARDYSLDVVVPAAADAVTAKVVGGVRRGRTRLFFDPSRTLAQTWAKGATGVTVVLVASNGTQFGAPVSNATTSTSLSYPLAQMADQAGISG